MKIIYGRFQRNKHFEGEKYYEATCIKLINFAFIATIGIITSTLLANHFCINIVGIESKVCNHYDLSDGDVVKFIMIVPLIETFFYQFVVIELLILLRSDALLQFSLSTYIFIFAHLSNGSVSAFSGGLFGGAVLAYTYIRWRKISMSIALIVTIIIHASVNSFWIFMINTFTDIFTLL